MRGPAYVDDSLGILPWPPLSEGVPIYHLPPYTDSQTATSLGIHQFSTISLVEYQPLPPPRYLALPKKFLGLARLMHLQGIETI